MDQFYSYQKTSKSKGDYIYHQPQCKECTKRKSEKWVKENPQKYKDLKHKYNSKPESIEKHKIRNRRWRENGKQREWYANNPELLSLYGEARRNAKKHKISKYEWKMCKEYFNNECAYCNMSYEEHKEVFGTDLHREHVDAEGSNKLDNCIPACLPCNSSKGTYSLEEWFTKENDIFDLIKLEKIQSWLTKDYKDFIGK